MSDEYINLTEHVNWLRSLEEEGKISELKIERIDNQIEISFKPMKPVEFISSNLKLNNQ